MALVWLTVVAWLYLAACFCSAGIIAYDITVNVGVSRWRDECCRPGHRAVLRPARARAVPALGGGQFDERDLVALQRHRDRGTADPIPLIAVSRSGASTTRVDAAFTPGQPDRSLVNRRCSASVRRSRPGGFTSSGKQSAPMRTPTVA
jgi:hypothetical protein